MVVHVRRPSSTSRRRRRRSPIKSVRQGVFVASAVMFAFGLLATVISCTIFICFKEKRFGVYLYTTLCRLCHYAALASQPLKPGTLSLYLSVPVPVLIPFVVTSRPTTASRPFNPLNPSLLAPQIFLTIVRVYKLYLLTYLLINDIYTQHMIRALNIVMTEIDRIKFIYYRPL